MKKQPDKNPSNPAQLDYLAKLAALQTSLETFPGQLGTTSNPYTGPFPKPDVLVGHILARLIELEAECGEIVILAKKAGDFKTAVKAIGASTRLLTNLGNLVKQFPRAAAAWRPLVPEKRPAVTEPPPPPAVAPGPQVKAAPDLPKTREITANPKNHKTGGQPQATPAASVAQAAPVAGRTPLLPPVPPGEVFPKPVNEDWRYLRK